MSIKHKEKTEQECGRILNRNVFKKPWKGHGGGKCVVCEVEIYKSVVSSRNLSQVFQTDPDGY